MIHELWRWWIDLNMGVMNLNEEVKKMLYYVGSNKTVRMPPEGRSTRPLNRASSWVGRANKRILSVACCSPLDRASLCFGRVDLLMLLGCGFWLFKCLGLFYYYLFIALIYLMLLSVISPINRGLICHCKSSTKYTPSQTLA